MNKACTHLPTVYWHLYFFVAFQGYGLLKQQSYLDKLVGSWSPSRVDVNWTLVLPTDLIAPRVVSTPSCIALRRAHYGYAFDLRCQSYLFYFYLITNLNFNY